MKPHCHRTSLSVECTLPPASRALQVPVGAQGRPPTLAATQSVHEVDRQRGLRANRVGPPRKAWQYAAAVLVAPPGAHDRTNGQSCLQCAQGENAHYEELSRHTHVASVCDLRRLIGWVVRTARYRTYCVMTSVGYDGVDHGHFAGQIRSSYRQGGFANARRPSWNYDSIPF